MTGMLATEESSVDVDQCLETFAKYTIVSFTGGSAENRFPWTQIKYAAGQDVSRLIVAGKLSQ